MKFTQVIEKLGDRASSENSLTSNPDLNPTLTGVAPIDESFPGSLSYIEGGKFVNMVTETAASALVLPLDEELQAKASERGIAWIATAQPRLLFTSAIALFYTPYSPPPGVHPTAVIDPSVELGKNVSINAHVVISAGVKIGDNVCIFPNVVIYPGVEIGNRTILHANCTIHERTLIGQDCVIHSGAAIGSEGFGFEMSPQGWMKMEQSGRTVLEDGVEIGCNSAVDRPAMGETRIGRNTKIDNLVQIGHSCQVGENCLMAGQVGIAGSSKIGNGVILTGQTGVGNRITIGDNVIATIRACILQDVEADTVVGGFPAIPHKDFLRSAAVYRRLPEMYRAHQKRQKTINNEE